MATTRKLVYPHPKKTPPMYIAGGVPGGLHQTSGLAGNYAYDFMAPGGTPVYAVEAGTLWKFSGHDPAGGVNGDIFGWNVYLHTRDGLMYFYTHLGDRIGSVGDRVAKGKLIGHVGHWPHDPGRSHTHLGVTHPMGMRASQRAIRNVTAAKPKGAV